MKLDNTMQDASEDLKRADQELAAAELDALASKAELNQLRQAQDGMKRCAATCDALCDSLNCLHARLAQQQALYQSVRGTICSGRRRAALDEFRNDLRNAQHDVCQINAAMTCAQSRLESSACAVSDAKGRVERVLHEAAQR